MKIKTFGPKELNFVEILKKESNKTALAAFLHSVAKYFTILCISILDSIEKILIRLSITKFPTVVDVSLNGETPDWRFTIFYLQIQNPNFKI